MQCSVIGIRELRPGSPIRPCCAHGEFHETLEGTLNTERRIHCQSSLLIIWADFLYYFIIYIINYRLYGIPYLLRSYHFLPEIAVFRKLIHKHRDCREHTKGNHLTIHEHHARTARHFTLQRCWYPPASATSPSTSTRRSGMALPIAVAFTPATGKRSGDMVKSSPKSPPP